MQKMLEWQIKWTPIYTHQITWFYSIQTQSQMPSLLISTTMYMYLFTSLFQISQLSAHKATYPKHPDN